MLERDVSPPSLLAGALRCQFKVLILLCLGSPSSPRSWRMDLAVLREDLNLSWGWQRPGDKSLCAWGDQTPLSQHLFGWHRDLCCELLATVVLHSVEGVWNFWCSLPWTLPRRSPPDGRKALNPARIPAACNWSRGKTRGTKELGEFIEGNFENSTLNLSTQTVLTHCFGLSILSIPNKGRDKCQAPCSSIMLIWGEKKYIMDCFFPNSFSVNG